MLTEIILLILEIIGTISFAVSGAILAIKARFDIFGVIVIGCLTAIGGGITRDVLIGVTPPVIFSKSYIVGIAFLAALTVFIIAYLTSKKFEKIKGKIEQINNIFDAIGLATFTIMGVQSALENGFSENALLAVTLGVLTGVGGGLLRDILTETPPYIFQKHVYALASVTGAFLYYELYVFIGKTVLSSIVASFFIVGIRLLATKYRWNLPKIQFLEENILKR